jgi:hypothetical protein
MDFAMKKGVVLFALGILSSMMAGNALAGPLRFQRPARMPQQQRIMPRSSPEEGEENREKDRADRTDHADKNAVNGQQAGPREGARNGETPRNPEGPRNPEAVPGGAQPPMPPGRPGARMSLEERQKLRRQINEAGRSLYVPSAPPAPTGNK